MKNPQIKFNEIKLDLPPPNQNLIPKNFDVLPPDPEYSSKPQLLKQWEDTDLWYKKDDQFLTPKVYIGMKLYTDDCSYGLGIVSRVFIKVWKTII